MIPQYNDLNYFIAIAETGNLSRASERLGVVQPTLSQAVKRLEDAAGARLLIRHKTGVELTRAGELLKNQAAHLINSWRFLVKEVQETETAPRGHFVVGAHPSVALYSLGKILTPLMSENERIEITLVHGLSREILEGVVSSRIDFGLVINPRRHPDLVIKPVCEDKVGFWSNRDTPRPILILDPSLMQTQSLLKKAKDPELFPRTIQTSSLEVAAELAASGLGTAILPERVAARHKLKPWSQGPWVQDELALCFRKDRQTSIASRRIIDAVIKARI